MLVLVYWVDGEDNVKEDSSFTKGKSEGEGIYDLQRGRR
jgi:hypothetical protein